jgi:hypothetical protein
MANQDKMSPSLTRIARDLKKLPHEAFEVFKAATPIKSGQARRNTKLVGSTIEANYNYAQVLDKGSSRQAPEGMTTPTDKFIKSKLDKIIRK